MPPPPAARVRCADRGARAAAGAGRGGREQQIGGSGGSLEPPGLPFEPPGPLLTHLRTVYMACSEYLPTHLNPLAEGSCFSQAGRGGGRARARRAAAGGGAAGVGHGGARQLCRRESGENRVPRDPGSGIVLDPPRDAPTAHYNVYVRGGGGATHLSLTKMYQTARLGFPRQVLDRLTGKRRSFWRKRSR
jgi:hypothetical protein